MRFCFWRAEAGGGSVTQHYIFMLARTNVNPLG